MYRTKVNNTLLLRKVTVLCLVNENLRMVVLSEHVVINCK